jgi:hypothetical protein
LVVAVRLHAYARLSTDISPQVSHDKSVSEGACGWVRYVQLAQRHPMLLARLMQLAGRHLAVTLSASLAQWSGPER